MRRILLMIAGLSVLTACVYWRVYHYPFIKFDDPDYVYTNPYVRGGFISANIHHAFVTYTGGNWNPLLWISFYVDSALFHVQAGPMHVENVVWHLIGGLLVWWFLREATGRFYLSYIVAALFLCHPMHVESVVWISERKDVLSTPFLIGAMLAYVKLTRAQTARDRSLAYGAMLLLFAASLLVKTMGITLPAVLLLLDFWPLRRWPTRSWLKLALEKIPLMLMSAAMICMGMLAQRYVGAATSFSALSLLNRINNAIVCYVLYAYKLIAPYDLAILYPHPGSRPAAAVFAALVLLLMVSYFVFRLRKKSPYAIVGWLWFLGTLVPVIGLFQIGSQAMADRYSYFPSIGLFILIVWGADDFLNRAVSPQKQRTLATVLQTGLIAMVLIAFTVLGHIQVGYWKDSESLFRHDLDVADDNAAAHVVLGGVYGERGDMKGAVDEFNAALKVGPNARAYYALANCWKTDDPAKSKKYFHLATVLEPRNIDYQVGFADSLLRSGDKPGAMQQIQAALALDPSDAGALQELQKIRSSSGK